MTLVHYLKTFLRSSSNKAKIFVLLLALVFTLTAVESKSLVHASTPTGTTTITEIITFNGDIDIQVSYPSKIYQGEDLPVTFKFVDGGVTADNIDKLQIVDGLTKWIFVNTIANGDLQEGESTSTYYFNTSNESVGVNSNEYGLEGVRYDKFLVSTDTLATTGGGYFTFEVVSSDTTAPVINGGSTFYSDVDNPDTIADVKATLVATDETDGDLTLNIINLSDNYTGNETTTGTYTTTWEVSDAAGNTTQVTVTVIVMDITSPVITINGDGNIIVEVHTSYTELGAVVSDNYDTGLAAVITGSVDVNTLGRYYIYYDATDTTGNEATTRIRHVDVVDTTLPVLTLTGSSNITLEVGSIYNEPGATVTDNYDTSPTVTTSGTVDTNTVGTYIVTYSSTDTSGNTASIQRTVNIVDSVIPVITMTGNSTEYVEYGSAYVDPGATASDNYDGNITADIVTVNPVDVGTLGTYYITYNVSDSSGNNAVSITRTVIVQDSIAPVINAADQVTFNSQSETLAELTSNMTAFDIHGGNLTAQITVVEDNYTANINVVGTYTVTFQVSDAQLNTTQITITIIVKDDLPPVFTASSYLIDDATASTMTLQEIKDHINSRTP